MSTDNRSMRLFGKDSDDSFISRGKIKSWGGGNMLYSKDWQVPKRIYEFVMKHLIQSGVRPERMRQFRAVKTHGRSVRTLRGEF